MARGVSVVIDQRTQASGSAEFLGAGYDAIAARVFPEKVKSMLIMNDSGDVPLPSMRERRVHP